MVVEILEIHFFRNHFRKCHTTLRVFPKRDGLTPSESLVAGLCTRTLNPFISFCEDFLIPQNDLALFSCCSIFEHYIVQILNSKETPSLYFIMWSLLFYSTIYRKLKTWILSIYLSVPS